MTDDRYVWCQRCADARKRDNLRPRMYRMTEAQFQDLHKTHRRALTEGTGQ